jgi:arsenate reductase-like glutaredoxin family protein
MLKIYGIRNCDTVRKVLKWAGQRWFDVGHMNQYWGGGIT